MAAHRVAGLMLAVGLYLLSPSCGTAGLNEGKAAYARGDYHVALREFMPLAQAGHPLAQFLVAVMYVEGEGVRQNEAEAVRWFRLAADQGVGWQLPGLGPVRARRGVCLRLRRASGRG
jgi:TPR repeat protein